ncbi:tRNA (adenosine(37)-N6)-threonylcarbamoyltransferase complex ATPase subunit type 1 TsaE [Sedimenticola selenatireducens]|uniref:tRNA threonylcarbamoyladenosine biosynthesis protein TsaE n=1 Tax=Sedimenticola selenatireducens TaxID=191960 RepID=A0A2N6CVP1_9GAMM|nr:tRNA (adenosine(37)-N6)-threonylcarbamoyltransferase complex ATPase subunit type 1 TsaE [Sedimenticola selenatireducens]PLX61286.1 MAG: tRNA (adenosine(37)-N6)-threonylcarbamoyltransferase complex ATPase subunit type 1 TsaE [Sedimenticola selenatireducens]
MLVIRADSERKQELIGMALSRVVPSSCLIYLTGDLGAGKTTLARGFLRGLGHAGSVKSPTYTLIEPYEIGNRRCYHLDLYRLADPDEIEFLGLLDMLQDDAIMLVEWPEQGQGALPEPDLLIRIRYLEDGRELVIEAETDSGARLMEKLALELDAVVKS